MESWAGQGHHGKRGPCTRTWTSLTSGTTRTSQFKQGQVPAAAPKSGQSPSPGFTEVGRGLRKPERSAASPAAPSTSRSGACSGLGLCRALAHFHQGWPERSTRSLCLCPTAPLGRLSGRARLRWGVSFQEKVPEKASSESLSPASTAWSGLSNSWSPALPCSSGGEPRAGWKRGLGAEGDGAEASPAVSRGQSRVPARPLLSQGRCRKLPARRGRAGAEGRPLVPASISSRVTQSRLCSTTATLLAFEHLIGLYNFSEQPVLFLGHHPPSSEKLFPPVQRGPPVLQFVPLVSCSVSWVPVQQLQRAEYFSATARENTQRGSGKTGQCGHRAPGSLSWDTLYSLNQF